MARRTTQCGPRMGLAAVLLLLAAVLSVRPVSCRVYQASWDIKERARGQTTGGASLGAEGHRQLATEDMPQGVWWEAYLGLHSCIHHAGCGMHAAFSMETAMPSQLNCL